MAKKLIMSIVALIGIIALVLTGCGGGGGGPLPVTIKILIRNNDLRLDIGNYVGNQLEDLGFEVVRQYGTGGQLSPIWMRGNPANGLWNVYTGAWINTAVPRDEGSNFGYFFTPLGAQGPLWDAYTPTVNYLGNATKLWWNDFSTMPQREGLFNATLPQSLDDSARVFLDDRTSYSPLRMNVAVAADLYGGVEGSMLWGQTIHFKYGNSTPILPAWDGGTNGTLTLRIALEDLLVEPWNPVAGSNWAFDQFPIRGTCDSGFEYDTRDGLTWPHLASGAEVTVLAGLPVTQNASSTGWLNLTTSPGPIAVPTTAWADWDTATGQFTAAGPGVTAKTKTVVYYPDGTFGRPLHDGSTLSAVDFLVYAALQFDRAKEGSPLYDEAYVSLFDPFMSHFKGVEFNFAPGPGYDLVVTTYDDLVLLDAELFARSNSWFPTGSMVGGPNLGSWIWHSMALGMLAESEDESAFSADNADAKVIEWMSFVSGPSLVGAGPTKGLVQYLDDVLNPVNPKYAYIPYLNVTGAYVNQTQALARYQNLKNWYGNYSNLWVGSGPYFLYDLDTTAELMELNPFLAYPDDGDLWFFLVDGNGKVAGQQLPTTPPDHNGAWFDKVTLKIITDEAAAVTQLQNDQLDLYAAGMTDPALRATVESDPDLHLYVSFGLFDELSFNPVGPFFPATGKLNPFHFPAIREAMNWALDRTYIVGDIYDGMASARYTCIGTKTADYMFRYPALLAATEAAYAYNFALANSTIYATMMAINGTTYVDGKYYYETPG